MLRRSKNQEWESKMFIKLSMQRSLLIFEITKQIEKSSETSLRSQMEMIRIAKVNKWGKKEKEKSRKE